MRPYSSTLTKLIQNLSGSLDGDLTNPYTTIRKEPNILIVSISSNRGLCGAFNSNIIKKTRHLIEETFSSQKVSLVTIGKKVQKFFQKQEKLNHLTIPF